MIRALLFDFDGLILDTEISAYQSWQEIYREYGYELPLEKWALAIGAGTEAFDPYSYLESLVGEQLHQHEAILKRRLQRHLSLIAEQKALPGVEDYIATAQQHGIKLAVASSSPREWLHQHLSRLGLLDKFDRLCCGDEVAHRKPDPELYLTALDVLGVAAHEAIVLEDSPNGVTAAQRAGIFCVAVPNPITGQLSLEHADMQLSSLAVMPLLELIDKVEHRRKALAIYNEQPIP